MSEPDLLISAGFSDAKLAQEAQKVIAKYKQMGDAAEKAFKDSTGAVAGSQALKAHQRELDQLSRKYDPVYVATKKYERGVKDLDRAFDLGRIDAKKYADEMRNLNVEMARSSGVIQDTATKTRGFGGNLSNIGFQVGDFATQVGAGTSATQALGQQLPQLLGGFGAVGAVAGAAAAILIPLAGAFLGAGEEAQTLEDQMDALEKSTDAMTSAMAAAAIPLDDLIEKHGELGRRMYESSQAMAQITRQTAAQDAIAALRGLSGDLSDGLPSPGAFLGPRGGVMPGYEKARAQLEAQAVKALGERLGASADEALRLFSALGQLGKGGTLDAAIAEGAELQGALAAISAETEAQQTALGAMSNQAGAAMALVTQQVEAGADTQVAAQKEVIAQHAETTTKLKELAAERAILEEAVKSGDAAIAEGAREALRLLDQQIDKYRQLARESDTAYQRMTSAYQEYAASRTAGNEWAQSPSGFQAQYIAERAAGSGSANEELVRATTALAEQMGISARDLLAVMSFETGGKLRPDVMGPTTKNGQHFGLIQFGDKGAGPRYGVTPQSSITQQVVAAGRYLQDAGVKAGDNLANIYAAVLSGDARKVHASDLAAGGVVGDVSAAVGGDQFAPHLARAEGLLTAYGGVVKEVADTEKTAASDRQKALNDEIKAREKQVEAAKQLGEMLASNLLTTQQTAELDARRAAGMRAIAEAGLTGQDRAAAVAQLNGELEKQETIWQLLAEAKRRNVDADALMPASAQAQIAALTGLTAGTITYAQAIAFLGEQRMAGIIVAQQEDAAMERLAERQQFMAQVQQDLKDGLLDSIVAGESFSDVLANVAQALAKAALQAALFNEGPFSGGGGGGLLGGLFKGFGSMFGGARAMGGPVSANTPYLVGERGPEIIVPRSAGQVIPNHKMGGGSKTVHLTIDVRGATGNSEVRQMVAQGVQQGMAQVRREVPELVETYRAESG